jgi:anti-repressor protein
LRVTTIKDDQGEPWFIAKDVCEVLGIKNYRDPGRKFSDDEKGVVTIDTLGGQQNVLISETTL